MVKTLQHIAGLVFGGIAVAGLLSVSIASNFQFGLLLADGPERYIYAFAGGFLDCLKTLLPIAVAAGLASRAFLRAGVGAILFAAIAAYSLSCAIGLYSLSKDERIGGVKAERVRYAQLVDTRDQIRADIAALDVDRAPGAVRGEIAALKHDFKYDRSRQCTNATVPSSRELCAKIKSAEAELADAMKAAALTARLRETEAALTGLNLQKVVSRADPAAEAVAAVIGQDPGTVRNTLAMMIAALIEAGSAFGFWLVSLLAHAPVHHQRTRSRNPGPVRGMTVAKAPEPDQLPAPVDPLRAWADECLSRDPSRTVTAAELRDHHDRWAATHGHKPASPTMIGRLMSEMKFKREKVNGRSRYAGARLASLESGPRLAVDNA